MRLNVRTNDHAFYQDLNAQGVDGLDISFFVMDSVASSADYVNLIVTVKDVAVGILAAWLYDRIKNGKTQQIIINGEDISDKPEHVFSIVKVEIIVKNVLDSAGNQHEDQDSSAIGKR